MNTNCSTSAIGSDSSASGGGSPLAIINTIISASETQSGTSPSSEPTIGRSSDLNAMFLMMPALLTTELVGERQPFGHREPWAVA